MSHRLELRLATIAALAASFLAAAGFVMAEGLWPIWLLLHVLTALALGLWVRRLARRRRALRYPALLAISTSALGFAGAVGAGFASLAQYGYRREARTFQDWYYTLFPPRERRKARTWFELARALGREGDGAVESFADLIRFGDIDQKLAVVALLARRFDPRFAPVLKAALSDPDASVRVQAATAAAHIEDAFVDRWVEAERRTEARKSDPKAHAVLARLLDDYAFAGILDERREDELRKAAEASYRTALRLDPQDEDALVDLGRLLIRLDRHEEALDVLKPLMTAPSVDAAAWLLEALFRLGRFDELHRLAGRMGADALPERLEDAVALWRPEEAAA